MRIKFMIQNTPKKRCVTYKRKGKEEGSLSVVRSLSIDKYITLLDKIKEIEDLLKEQECRHDSSIKKLDVIKGWMPRMKNPPPPPKPKNNIFDYYHSKKSVKTKKTNIKHQTS